MREEYDFKKSRRGLIVPAEAGKTRITIRIDNDVLDWFRHQADQSGGGQYQSLINKALRQHIRENECPLEDMIRTVVREELGRAAG
mgnify:CR=1 FL=1